MKKCSRCQNHFDEFFYYKDASRRDGLDAVCKKCHKEKNYIGFKNIVCDKCGRVQEINKNSRRKYCNVCTYSRSYIKSIDYKKLEIDFYNNKYVGKNIHSGLIKKIKTFLMKEQNNSCDICGIPNIWNEKDIVFIFDHIDGDSQNNTRKNIRLICPNCDSQLDTYKSKNKNSNRPYRKEYYNNIIVS